MSDSGHGGQYYNYQYEQYENTLRVLLIKFFREVNLPFSTADNPIFQDVIRHLNPSVVPPDMKSLVEMGINNINHFNYEEKCDFHGKMRERISKKEPKFEIAEQPKRQQVFNHIAPIPAVPYHFAPYDHSLDGSYQAMVPLPLDLTRLPNEEDYQQIGHYEYKSGASMWPCLVCLKRPAWATMRKLTQNEATVFLFVCVAEGVYPLDIAKQLCALKTVVCCVTHLTPVYNASLRRLGISSPNQINSADAALVAYANTLINDIRGVKCEETLRTKMESRVNGAGPFRHTLRCFFRNYQKKALNAFQKTGPPSKQAVLAPKQKEADPNVPNTTYLPPGTLQRPGDDLEFPEDFLETM